MLPIDQCIICSGNIKEQEVTEIIQGGNNTATLTVKAWVCQKCGERYYNADIVRKLEEIKVKLKDKETKDFTLVGQFFKVD